MSSLEDGTLVLSDVWEARFCFVALSRSRLSASWSLMERLLLAGSSAAAAGAAAAVALAAADPYTSSSERGTKSLYKVDDD